MTNKLLRDAIRGALYGGAALAIAAPAAVLAQDDKAEKLETIEVVGSRIKRTDVETSQPVFVLERGDLEKTGLTSIGDILQRLTTNGATLNTTFNNGGNGSTLISLRNLGANRTLVLVNGKRWVTQIGGTVDLNTIPSAIVERVEVLKDGASSIYGSDAIAGVVNITTRQNYDGAEASAYLGENSEGDGRQEAYDFTIGSSSERGSVVLNASYVKQEPILAGDREISSVPLFGIPANNVLAGASSTTRFGRFARTGTPGTFVLKPGEDGRDVSDYRPYNSATDGFNFAPENYLSTPQERTSMYAQARYNITDNIVFKTELLFNQRTSSLLLAPTPLTFSSTGTFASPRNRASVFLVPATNVYNPFGVNVTRVQLRMPENHPRIFATDDDTFRFSSTLEGAFDLGDRNFSWNANYTFAQGEQTNSTDGLLDLGRVALAVGPNFRDANGVVQCGTPTTPIIGCVPLNVFGTVTGITEEAFDYISFKAIAESQNKLYNYSANITGDLFELPAGPLGFAAGYEYRRETAFNQPDPLSVNGQSSGNQAFPVAGGFSLDEFYVEFNVPLLKDVAGAEILEFTAATRYSDYSSFGDTTNSKFGFRWKPFSDLLVRGNYAKGFRAPNIAELFTGQNDNFPLVFDPCWSAVLFGQFTTGLISESGYNQVLANCVADGVPEGYVQANAQIRTTAGGNPNLTPEKSTSKTLGFVYSPSWAQGLDIYLDWYDIKITNAIGANGAAAVLNACYLVGNFNPNSLACQAIERDALGNVTEINAPTSNTGTTKTEGYDFTIDYRWDTSVGKFHANWDTNYTSVWTAQVTPDTPAASFLSTYNTFFPNWRIRSNVTLDWSYGDWGATAGMRYLSALDENCAGVVLTGYYTGLPELENLCSKGERPGADFSGGAARVVENELDAVYYFDLQATWSTPWNGRIALGVRNVTDEDPPVAFNAFANSFDPQYDVPGRFWYVQYTQKF